MSKHARTYVAHWDGIQQTGGKHLKWFEPAAIPRFMGCPHHCRDPYCADTNWGGTDRVHTRWRTCPEYKGVVTPCPECRG